MLADAVGCGAVDKWLQPPSSILLLVDTAAIFAVHRTWSPASRAPPRQVPPSTSMRALMGERQDPHGRVVVAGDLMPASWQEFS